MKTQTVFAYAKINLFLDVTSKRSDGYHNIDSIMQTVSLYDTVTVAIHYHPSGIIIKQKFENSDLPCDETNLCYKAAMAYLEHFGLDNIAVDITVQKEIPCQAGLAGGSSDAAAVIKALNSLLKQTDDTKTLSNIGLKVGSDVPFCINGGTCAVQGRGEVVSPLASLPHYYIVLAKSELDSVSTKEAYSRIDNSPVKNAPIISFADYLKAIVAHDMTVIENGVFNIFQNVMADTLTQTNEIIDIIKNSGAAATLMSGSGPTVFGLYNDKSMAENALKLLNNRFFAVLCEPV